MVLSASRVRALAAWLAALCALAPGSTARTKIQVGDPLPPIALQTEDGGAVDLSEKRVRVLLFLRSDREFERQAVEDVQAIVQAVGEAEYDARIVWVRGDSDEPVPDLEIGGESWFDRGRKAVSALGIIVYPTTLVVSKSGQVVEILKSHPPGYRARVESALLLSLGRIDEDEFRRRRGEAIAREDPNLEKARLLANFAARLSREGRAEEALARFERARSLAPDDPRVLESYAEHLLRTDEVDDAEKLIRHATDVAPADPGVRLVTARILARRGDLDAADQILERLIDIHPDRARVLFERGAIREAQERWREAARFYREAAALLLEDRRSG